MAFGKNFTIDIDKLAKDLGHLGEAADRVRLAGYGLAQPLLDLQVGQMRREVTRVANRKGSDHPEVAARQAALKRAEARIELFREEFERAQLAPAVIKSETGAGLWGRVAKEGHPAEGMIVIVAVDGQRIDFRCTDSRGAFAMEVPSGTPLTLSVRSREGAEFHRDPEGTVLKPGQQQFREIDLARNAQPPCTMPPPESAGADDTFPMIDIVDQEEATAKRVLLTQGLNLAERKEKRVKGSEGRILSQKPIAREWVRRGDKVSILVGAPAQIVVPPVVGMPIENARTILKESKLAIGKLTEVTAAREKIGFVLEQDPVEGAEVKYGSAVALQIGTFDKGHEIIVGIAKRTETLRHEADDKNIPKNFVIGQLEQAQVKDLASLDHFLALDRKSLQKLLGLRTLTQTDQMIAALKQARSEVDAQEG
ncbi:PASTA domain-containing protein [Nitrosospira sp. Nsp13]|uniref:PASTA domain-containing protein n=1 Tax=Nitrosospira sp. Nsp13 TaxID=1855332 RepID=UPI000887CDED|nr:PASTA domain-containing protein [Nitrosospira sp. Nsp13]SCX79807.1 PASTA domain-containing protein [Nitrosospira sp. Nsp13]